MIKKISIIIVFLLLICGISTADNYIINGDIVYIDNSKVYLSANPHTLSSSGWVYFNLTSKVYTGNIDTCWGFNTSVSKPTKVEVYNPHWVNTTTNHKKTFYNSTSHVYTGNDLNYGNSYNINYKYTITESIVNENGTIYIISNAAFDSFDTDGINYTIYWHNRHDNYYLWEDFSSSFNSIIFDYEGYDKWYYIKNISITSNKKYTVRAWIDVPVSTQKQSGKYYFAIKPSGETISQSINNGHFYNLDPWWNATWSNRKEIILTGGTSGTQTDYQVLLNVTYESEMQSDFDDLRFCNETHQLDAWLKLKVDSSYALVWVEFPTTPASGVNQTYYMYYGNTVAANYWDGDATFLFFDDAESGAFYDKWTDIISSGQGAYSTDDVYAGTYSIKVTGDLADPVVASTVTGFSNAVFEAEIKQAGDAGRRIYNTLYGRMSNSVHTGYLTRFNNIGVAELFKIVAGSYTLLDSVASSDDISTWQHWELVCDGTTIESYYNGNLRNTAIDSDIASGGIGIRSTSSTYTYADNVRIRKYAANPPTYAFGSEEYYIPPTPTTLINETKLIMSEITQGIKGINMGNYLVYAFIFIGILLIILGIQIITNNIYRR
jgi:hypothetical protein